MKTTEIATQVTNIEIRYGVGVHNQRLDYLYVHFKLPNCEDKRTTAYIGIQSKEPLKLRCSLNVDPKWTTIPLPQLRAYIKNQCTEWMKANP